MRSQMNREKRISLLLFILILIAISTWTTLKDTGIFDVRYSSIDDTIIRGLHCSPEVIIHRMETEEYTLLFRKKPGNVIATEELCHDKNGWHVVSKKTDIPAQHIVEPEYTLIQRKYHGKNIFIISGKLNSDGKPPEVSNSAGIEFVRYEIVTMIEPLRSTSYWVLSLKEIPENYSITINGKKIDAVK